MCERALSYDSYIAKTRYLSARPQDFSAGKGASRALFAVATSRQTGTEHGHAPRGTEPLATGLQRVCASWRGSASCASIYTLYARGLRSTDQPFAGSVTESRAVRASAAQRLGPALISE